MIIYTQNRLQGHAQNFLENIGLVKSTCAFD